MRLNPSKCEFLCISNKRSPIDHSYYLNNHLLQCSSSIKYLGVIVDSKLSWNKHVSHVSLKASRTLNLLHCNMYTCNSSAKRKEFRALVLSVLDYASTVWNPHTQKNISALEKIQNRRAHWVCGSRYNCHSHTWSKSSSECCHELHWSSLSTGQKYLTIVAIYDIYHCHIFLPFSSSFSFTNSCTRSHFFSLQCKQSSINSYKFSFFVSGIFLRNSVPHDILSLPHRSHFRRELHKFL